MESMIRILIQKKLSENQIEFRFFTIYLHVNALHRFGIYSNKGGVLRKCSFRWVLVMFFCPLFLDIVSIMFVPGNNKRSIKICVYD